MSKKNCIKIIATAFLLLIAITIFNVLYNENGKNKSEYKYEENSDMISNIIIKVNNSELEIKLENNESSHFLLEKLKQGDIVVNASEYGNFEKVGDLGFDVPRNDKNIKTKAGDLMLYQGNKITLFYNSNSWSYTKIGEVIDKNQEDLQNILGSGDVTLILSIK